LAVAGSRFTYAIGKLTLWSVDEGRITSDGQAALKAGDVRHIAIANPDLAPYGVAARETLQSLELLDFLKPKIVMGQNIGQTHSMVATGNAQLGFVALSAVLSPREKSKGSRWDVPQNLFTPIRQDAVLLNAGAKNEAAIAFMKFLKTPDARTVIERYGYDSEIPHELTEYVRVRKFYDYDEHSRVGAKHGEFVTDEICDRFCVLGNAEQASAKLKELEAIGVDQFNIYLMTHGQEEDLAAYGRDIIPSF